MVCILSAKLRESVDVARCYVQLPGKAQNNSILNSPTTLLYLEPETTLPAAQKGGKRDK